MRLIITGDGTLAAATRQGCAPCFLLLQANCHEADVVWICNDIPLNAPDPLAWSLASIKHYLDLGGPHTPILISSQIPLGTIARLERVYPRRSFAYSPENLRVATAAADFASQDRVIVGRRATTHDHLWRSLFAPFTSHLILTDPETAELIKHTLNSYLGLSIAFINEIARVAEVTGADISTITHALRTEARISPHAPLRAGPPFGEGHLARDIQGLMTFAHVHALKIPLIRAIHTSNEGGPHD